MTTDHPTTFIDRLIADSPYTHLVQCKDGSPPMLIFGDRPLAEGLADMFSSAIRNCKPVPTVLGRRARSQRLIVP